MDYAGAGLVNKRMLVCHKCMDKPQDQFRAIVIPADPVPISNPRIPAFAKQRTDKRITIGKPIVHPFTGLSTNTGDQRITEDKQDRIVQANGNDLFNPKYTTNYRITLLNEYRRTQDDDARITQPMAPVPYPPGPGPGPIVNGIRLTQSGLIRVGMDGRIRDITLPEPSPVRLTQDGRTRVTQDGRIRDVENKMLVVKGRITVSGRERITQKNEPRGAKVDSALAYGLKRKEDD